MQAAVVPAVNSRREIKEVPAEEAYKLRDVNQAFDRVAEGKARFRAAIVS